VLENVTVALDEDVWLSVTDEEGLVVVVPHPLVVVETVRLAETLFVALPLVDTVGLDVTQPLGEDDREFDVVPVTVLDAVMHMVLETVDEIVPETVPLTEEDVEDEAVEVWPFAQVAMIQSKNRIFD
jgi:hypothetical protein